MAGLANALVQGLADYRVIFDGEDIHGSSSFG
jgi:hypothetical protein